MAYGLAAIRYIRDENTIQSMTTNNSKLFKSQKSLMAKTEVELAAYQTRQIGNNCSFHAITAGIQLLLNYKIDPNTLAQEINAEWWRGSFMRVFPNWAVTPRMQVRIIDYLAQTRNLPIGAIYTRGTIPQLLQMLSDPNTIPIITLIWLWGQAPAIYYADNPNNLNQANKAQGHTMALAAYDPDHISGDLFHTPWGFINSWRDKAQHLYWMTEADFIKAWRFYLPRIGPNPLVLLQSTPHLKIN